MQFKIVSLLLQRSESGLTALAHKFGRGLHQLAMNILGNDQDSEETVSDTYLALWNSIPPQRPNPLPPYVYRTGRNLALKRLRANTAQKRDNRYDLCLEELAEGLPGGTMEDAIDARRLGQAINAFLATLSQENRVLFLRRYWYGDSIPDLARLTGMNAGVVSTRLSRMRSSLRDYLEKEDIFL